MHPLGETHLLTVGRAGDDGGLRGEWQVQLFDVSDLKNPEQVDTLVPSKLKGGRAYSEQVGTTTPLHIIQRIDF